MVKHPEQAPEFNLSPLEQKAYELLAGTTERADELDFIDEAKEGYNKAAVEADLALIAHRKSQFEKQNTSREAELKKLSDIFELLFAELVELYNWLGDNAFIVNTSEFDDIVGGTDMVIEFLKDGKFNYLGLAIDVTFSHERLGKKLQGIADHINDEKLVTIKYYQSGNGDLVGKLPRIPRVIIGASRRVIDELVETKLTLESLMRRKSNPTPSEDLDNLTKQIKEVKAKLANHPIQFEILDQLTIQLKYFRDYCIKTSKHSIAAKYHAILEIVEKIRDRKGKDADLVRIATSLEHPDRVMDLMSLKIEESLKNILGS